MDTRIGLACLATAVVVALAAATRALAPEPLTVMTFNIRYGTADDGPDRWELRRGQLIDLLKAQDPDVRQPGAILPTTFPWWQESGFAERQAAARACEFE